MKRSLQLLTLSIFLLFSSQGSLASHLLGGEITWECITRGPNKGKLIFEMRLYRACYAGAAGVGSSASMANPLYGNHGGPSSVSLTRIEVRDLSSDCYNPNRRIPCGITIANGGGYAMEMNIYRSSPVQINGIPDPAGSAFSWSSCCRPGNLVNANGNTGYWLRAVMYPYKDPLTGNFMSLGATQGGPSCYDSSPKQAAPPAPTACWHQDVTYWINGTDPCDSLVYDWSPPMRSATSSVIWKTGYNDTLQLPNTNHSSLNVNPVLDKVNGKIEFKTAFTPASGYHTIGFKTSSYKNGQLVAEIFRDVPVSILNCDTTSPPVNQVRNPNIPTVEYREKGSTTWQNAYSKTYNVGDIVELDIRVQDFDSLPTVPIGLQSVSFDLIGISAASEPNDSTNCQNAPCAYLDSNNVAWKSGQFIDTTSITVRFRWNTSCLNLERTACESDGVRRATHIFKVSARDNYCQPGRTESIFYIVLEDTNQFGMVFDTLDASKGGARISWQAYTGAGFKSYEVMRSNSASGPWTTLTSINNVNQTSYYDAAAATDQQSFYYRVELDNDLGCGYDQFYRSIHLNGGFQPNWSVQLDWNLPYASAPSYPGHYIVDSSLNGRPWQLMYKSSFGTESYNLSPVWNRTLQYKVTSTDSGRLQAVSNIIEIRKDTTVGISNSSTLQGINIYPIPARDELFIELNEGKEIYPIQIDLINNQGKTCYSGSMNEARRRIDLSGMAPGVYLIRFKSRDGQLSTGRFIKIK